MQNKLGIASAIGSPVLSLPPSPFLLAPQRALGHITGRHITSVLEVETLPVCAGWQVVAVVDYSPRGGSFL